MDRQRLIDLRPQDLHLVTEDDLKQFPSMTSWFNPVLLFKLLKPVIISQIFGEYADRRLVVAALDTVDEIEHVRRANVFEIDPNAAVWFDYVSDLGDGFDATYAIAYLLAQPNIKVAGKKLPRPSLVVMGGDEVYPYANTADYVLRMRHPYGLALPVSDQDKTSPTLMAVPGNHDWYDGLSNFLSFFCRTEGNQIGGWRTKQRRSYFAVRLSEKWWLWSIDIALIENMDQPQADYFRAIVKEMDNAYLILCSSEPGWYNAAENSDGYRALGYAAWIAEKADRNIKIALCLSGDTHHYARYRTDFGMQFMTAGGGGAFLHGTHELPLELRFDWLGHPDTCARLAQQTTTNQKSACYPDKATSKCLLLHNLWFPITNWGFSLTLGVIYALAGCMMRAWPSVGPYAVGAVFLLFCLSYISYQERRRTRPIRIMAIVLGAAHGAAHFLAVCAATHFFVEFTDNMLGADATPWLWWPLFIAGMIVTGTLVGGMIFGLSLIIGSGLFNIAHNDAFSAMRLDSYRHFLRIKIEGSKLTIYPIGLDRVPRRNGWRKATPAEMKRRASTFQPKTSLQPKLIEEPIMIDASTVH